MSGGSTAAKRYLVVTDENELSRGVLASFAAQRVSLAAENKEFHTVWARCGDETKRLLCLRAMISDENAVVAWADMPKPERLKISTYLRAALVTFASIGVDMMGNE